MSGHTHPVYELHIVGTENAHQLISASRDGLVCTWQMDMLSKPIETLELKHFAHPRTDEVAITTFDFPRSETASFLLGTEEGTVYQAKRYERAGSKAGIQKAAYQGHSAMVTGLHVNPHGTSQTEYFLTSSMDWTVKLWSYNDSKATDSAPLCSFECFEDYVYDVKWSPTRPSMFATVDGTGKLQVFHLSIDTEVSLFY
jgi:dynein intermediate chain